jgi:hypothetical protein
VPRVSGGGHDDNDGGDCTLCTNWMVLAGFDVNRQKLQLLLPPILFSNDDQYQD